MANVTLNEGNSVRARKVLEANRRIRPDLDSLTYERDVMIQLLNNADSGVEANFGPIATAYAAASNADAKKMFDELSAAIGSLAALNQYLAIIPG